MLRGLLDNAVKYSPPGSQISVALTTGSEGVSLSVKDTGPGFPENELDHLTDRFTRGANAQSIVGSGLGLTIVHNIAEMHGGSIDIASRETEGTECIVTLPLRQKPQKKTKQANAES